MVVGWARGVFVSPTVVDLPLMLFLLSARRMEIVSVLEMHADSLLANNEPMVDGERVIRSVFHSLGDAAFDRMVIVLTVYGPGNMD